MEDDSCLKDHDTDELIVVSRPIPIVFGHTMSGVLDKKRDEETRHENSSARRLIFKLANALIGEHEGRMRQKLVVTKYVSIDHAAIGNRSWLANWETKLLTCTKAVEMITPVPNCLRILKITWNFDGSTE